MIVSYVDIFGNGERETMNASITTDHATSSYGRPVIVHPDGASIGFTDWLLLNYTVVECTKEEQALMNRWLTRWVNGVDALFRMEA